jgi:dTDP-glucose 4,6-dehydratase
MKVVLTGGAGFIGSNLAHHWVRHHPADELLVVDALTYAGHRASLADLEGSPRFSFRQADIGDAAAMGSAVRGAGLVLNLAAETHNDRAIADPLPFVRTNVLGTAVLLEACRKADVPRLHHVSTDEVYGSLELDEPARFTESSPYRPRGPYSSSKAASDHLVRAWHETYGLGVTISNCGNNFGPYQHPEKLIPLAITRLIQGEKVPLYGDGRHVRDWIFVDDHCGALDEIAHRGRNGSTYLVSSRNEVPNREIVLRLAALFGRGPEVVQPVADRPGHDRRYGLEPARLEQELGWRPRVPFEEGLERTVRWYRERPDWWTPLVTPRRSPPVPS